mmetsp:Transcript_3067/g.4696  ORF Transcript_3067/g.4696 Transcript_3067/m.4696 type:complete len:158 (+) Transcript_3067:143-616(+)|eukprot:CAMPEP_0170512816 /NCGR_PEP_ID=MMETSP0208-20121228/67053_1 /TAXON_ID=197538 /ORGANISM="Strombidium inclinatum, Strain S3" /LENGTH=157 /DNA_ID=CAMNT_0010796481 /DNA_START=624 /DNA_END=1097 /DNA_ORIENTATION=-
MRKRKMEDMNNKKQFPTENDMMTEEFTKYRGKDMFTPKEPYLNCVLYDEIPHKTQVRNSPQRQRKQAKIKSVPADNIKGIMTPLKVQKKQSTVLRFVTDDSSRFDSKRNSKGSDTQGSKTGKSRKRNLSVIEEEAILERRRKEIMRERRQSKMVLKK